MKTELLEVHKELMGYRYFKKELIPIQNRINELRRLTIKTSGGVTKIPEGSTSQSMEAIIAEICDLEREWQSKFNERERICLDIDARINKLEDHFERIILNMYYCQEYTLEEIAVTFKCSFQWVFKTRNKGLENYREKYVLIKS